MSICVKNEEGISVLSISGRVDASNSGQIHDRIMDEIEQGKNKVVVDFSDVSYISSAGLRVLLYASKALNKKEGSFAICSVNDSILKIFQISGLAGLFNIHKDLTSTLNDLKSV